MPYVYTKHIDGVQRATERYAYKGQVRLRIIDDLMEIEPGHEFVFEVKPFKHGVNCGDKCRCIQNREKEKVKNESRRHPL